MVENILKLMQAGDWEGATKEAEKVVTDHPSSADAQAYMGLCHFHFSRFAEAEQHFRAATTLNPKFWEAGVKHAMCLDRLQRYEEAYEVAKRWLDARPSDVALQRYVHGLSLHVQEKMTDSWQVAAKPTFHQVTLAQD